MNEFCMRIFSDTVQAGACQPYNCDPTATPGQVGACVGTQDYCRSLSASNPSIGRCIESCDLENDPICTDASADCFPAYFLTLFSAQDTSAPTTDLCEQLRPYGAISWPLDELASCSGAGFAEFDPCGPTSVCLSLDQLAPGILCYDTCDLTLGAGANHPDCNPGRTCTQIFVGINVGLCTP
jgi:hypothetical protein